MRRKKSGKYINGFAALAVYVEATIRKLTLEFSHASHHGEKLSVDLGFQHIESGRRALTEQFERVSCGAAQGETEYAANGQQNEKRDAADQDRGQTGICAPGAGILSFTAHGG